MELRVLLVSKSAAFRYDLSQYVCLLGEHYRVVGEAGSADDAMRHTQLLRPNVVVIDMGLPGSSGLSVTRLIQHHWPDTAVIVIGDGMASAYHEAASSAGAIRYVPKLALLDALPEALASVAPGPVGQTITS
jgi:DNA-binding NarL/FixJ family response regulator